MTKRFLAAPAIGTGALMAAYLLARPYGDHSAGITQADALASPWWVFAHVCGALSIASWARLTTRLAVRDHGLRALIARGMGLLGTVLVLPYYGAETFALHVIGTRAQHGDLTALDMVAQIRNQPVAVTMFGSGLALLAASGITAALAWRHSERSAALWPLGMGVALILPQFYLPAGGRMAFGVAYLAAALAFAGSAMRGERHDAVHIGRLDGLRTERQRHNAAANLTVAMPPELDR